MHRLAQLYRFVNVISLDVVGGAIASALFFAELMHVRILPYGLIALALTVWIIYTADHLRDAKTIKHDASTYRHRFHQQHFKTLMTITIVVIVIDSIIILFMRKTVFEWGLVLAVIVVGYLIIQQYLRILKELFVAILYTSGVLLPSLAVTSLEFIPLSVIVQFALIAWINLLLFSWFDYEQDLADGQVSFATLAGKHLTAGFIVILTVIQLVVSVVNWIDNFYRVPTTLFVLMNLVLVIVFIGFKKPGRNDSFRWLGDAVFFIPGIYLLWARL